jgi:hypothetical protein
MNSSGRNGVKREENDEAEITCTRRDAVVRRTRRRVAASTAAKADDVKMGYINKMGEHPGLSPKSPEHRPKPESSE